MLQVLIVGDRESGKTTFLTLLYAASVKSGGEKADEFRFHAPIESMEKASLLYQQLMSGAFPDGVTKQEVDSLTLHIVSRQSRGRLLARFRSNKAPEGLSELRFTRLGALDEELPQMLRGSVATMGGWKNILDADVVTMIVDSSKLAVKVSGAESSPMASYDTSAETVLNAIRRLRPEDDRRSVYPVFAFSKFDRVPPEALKAAKVGATPPPIGDRGRVPYAEALLGPNMPKALACVQLRERDGPRFAKPAYFFSWVRTEGAKSSGAERIRLGRAALSGWEPEYPREEFLAYLEYLDEIGSRAGT